MAENIPTKDMGTINPKPVTKHMEVDHPAHREKKKNWNSYIWELLMLFLAVFCGFFAENYREDIADRKRTKLYAQQFYEELKLDTISLGHFIRNSEADFKRYDTITKILSSGVSDNKKWKDLYYYSFGIDSYLTIDFHNASFEQIKNSGSLRYFTSKPLVDAMQAYISLKDGVELFQTSLINYYDNRLTPFVDANFDKKLLYYDCCKPDRNRFDSSWDISSPPTHFLSEDKNASILLNNMAFIIKVYYVSGLASADKKLLKKATHLVDILKKEYHFEQFI